MASFMHIGRLGEFLCLESCLRNHAELLDKDKKTVCHKRFPTWVLRHSKLVVV